MDKSDVRGFLLPPVKKKIKRRHSVFVVYLHVERRSEIRSPQVTGSELSACDRVTRREFQNPPGGKLKVWRFNPSQMPCVLK